MIAGLQPWAEQATAVGAALAIGALVGLERGFTLRGQREGRRVAGVRTFTLLGLGAGVAGVLSATQPYVAAIWVCVVGAALLGLAKPGANL